MKKLIYLFAMVMLVSGCFQHYKRPKVTPSPPHETAEFNNFKSTPKDDAKFFQTIGLGFFEQKRRPEAKFYLAKAVTLDPKLYWAWYCLGLLNRDDPEGYNCFKKSVEVKPDFPLPYYWMAYYHSRKRENQKAIQLFKKYIALAKGKRGEEERLKDAEETLQGLLSGKEVPVK